MDCQAVCSYGEAFIHQGREVDLPITVQENVLDLSAPLANEVVVLNNHGVIPSHPFTEQEHPDPSFFDQSLQIPVDRAEADARKRPTHTLIDLISAGMRMIPLQGLVHRRQLPGCAFVNFTDHE
jgi:hypothetical protein